MLFEVQQLVVFTLAAEGWRCRACGSWEIYVAILGDVQASTSLAYREKGHEQGMPSKTRGKDVRPHALSVSPRKDDDSQLCSPPSTKGTQTECWYILH